MFNLQWMVYVFWGLYWNILFGGKVCYGVKEMVFVRVIWVGENSSDIIFGVQQGLDIGVVYIVISEDYGFYE